MATAEDESIKVTQAPVISMKELFGGQIPERPDMTHAPGPEFYKWFGEQSLFPFKVDKPEDVREYIVLGPPINGKGVNALAYFVARNRTFGFDTGDIKNDWVKLYQKLDNQRNAERLINHQGLPGWGIFEQRKDILLEAIKRDQSVKSPQKVENPQDQLVPVASWEVNGKGEKTWQFDLPEEPEVQRTLQLVYTDLGLSLDQCDLLMGLMLMGTFSYDITSLWPDQDSHMDPKKGTQGMGATQSLAFALRRCDELLTAKVIHLLESHCDGTLDSPSISKPDIEPVKPKGRRRFLPF